MALDSSAFERYRRSPNEKTTIFRLILGVIIIVLLRFGPTMAVVARAGAVEVKEQVIAGSGHWLMEEQPAATVAAIDAFLNGQPAAAPSSR